MKKVFFGPESGIWKSLHYDAVISEECEYCDYDESKHSRFQEIFISTKIQKKIPLFLRRLIYKTVFRYTFFKSNSSESLLFVFSNAFSLFGSDRFFSFLDFLKEQFPNSKSAIHYMESLDHCYPEQIDRIKESFDIVLSFDHYDSDRYGVEYYPPVCEKDCIAPAGNAVPSDVFYVGGISNPKFERVEFCTRIFQFLSDNGKVCVFFLCGVSAEKQIEIANKLGKEITKDHDTNVILYQNSKIVFRYLPYAYALSYIKLTKAMLEIVPRGQVSCTSRLAQAMVENKKFITNSPTTVLEPYYRPENMLSFESPEDIDLAFFDKEFVPIDFDFSTLGLISYIENRLLSS